METGLEIISPGLESVNEQLHIEGVVVELATEECEGVNLTILSAYRENPGDGVIRGVCPDHWRKGRVVIVRMCRTKGVEMLTLRRQDSWGALACKPSQ